jgi:hypothetical protein
LACLDDDRNDSLNSLDVYTSTLGFAVCTIGYGPGNSVGLEAVL